ncbi:MAG: hypothetical protein M5U28_51580 [Sandaracinaceae bacterium]|nr:hypothetical protein [Sandaracinaceae bacterium]
MRLIYLGGDAPIPGADDKSTRHVTRGDAEAVLTEARPERRAADPEPDEMAKTKKKKKKPVAEAAPPPEETRASAEPEEEEAEAKDAAEEAAEAAAPEPAPEAREDAPAPAPPAAPGSPLVAVAWAFGVLVLGLLILAVLARLPPIE